MSPSPRSRARDSWPRRRPEQVRVVHELCRRHPHDVGRSPRAPAFVLGRLVPHKRVELALEVMARLRAGSDRPVGHARTRLVGEQEPRRGQTVGIGDVVDLVGYVTGPGALTPRQAVGSPRSFCQGRGGDWSLWRPGYTRRRRLRSAARGASPSPLSMGRPVTSQARDVDDLGYGGCSSTGPSVGDSGKSAGTSRPGFISLTVELFEAIRDARCPDGGAVALTSAPTQFDVP